METADHEGGALAGGGKLRVVGEELGVVGGELGVYGRDCTAGMTGKRQTGTIGKAGRGVRGETGLSDSERDRCDPHRFRGA
jgi:hypothetical protein